MVNPKWGTKRNCSKCATKFYDLLKDPIICPNCETIFKNEVISVIKKPKKEIKSLTEENITESDQNNKDFTLILDDENNDDIIDNKEVLIESVSGGDDDIEVSSKEDIPDILLEGEGSSEDIDVNIKDSDDIEK